MTATTTRKPNPWLLAARPKTLPASISPVLVGSALALREGQFDVAVFLATLAAAVLLQIGANYSNDVFDYLKGADKARVGPTRVTQSGMVTPRQMMIATGVVFGLAALLGLYLVSVGGWPILLIGLVSIVCAVAYTAGPFPLAYRGLGDVFAFVFFGVVAVMGAYFLQTQQFTWMSFIASLPNALFATCIIITNNLRDIDTDRAAGKHTLAVRIGERSHAHRIHRDDGDCVSRAAGAAAAGHGAGLGLVAPVGGRADCVCAGARPVADAARAGAQPAAGPHRAAESAVLGVVFSLAFTRINFSTTEHTEDTEVLQEKREMSL